MRTPVVAIIAIGCALTLSGCVTSADALSGVAGEAAEYPEWLDESLNLPTAELTLLRDDGEMIAYASRDDDNWCVVAVLAPSPSGNGDDWGASASCVPLAIFADRGAIVSFSMSGRSGGAHLLPPGYNKPLKAGWIRVSPQLAVTR